MLRIMLKMTMNVLVGFLVMLLVFGPEKAMEIYLNAHATITQALMTIG